MIDWFQKRTLSCVLLLLLCTGILAGSETEEASSDSPNIILLLIDDMGYGDIAAHGNPLLKTPNFDRLHDESLRFTDFLVSPTCAPTRAALLTGMHELRSGVSHTIPNRNLMDLNAITLPQVLKAAGYHTAIFGKWHLGMYSEPHRPYNRGFDIALNQPTDNQRPHYDPVLLRNGVLEQHKGYRTDIFFTEAMRYIEDQAKEDGPFFCYLATFTPHSPLVVPDKYTLPYLGKSARPEYHGMVAIVDENLGRLLDKLDELGIADDTLLIALGDNGGTYGIDTWNAGMRGAKATAWLGGVRTFSFWRWPDQFSSGDCKQLTCHHDVLPTLARIAGAQLDINHIRQLEGYDLNPLLTGSPEDWDGDNRMIVHHSTRWAKGKADQHKYAFAGIRWGKYHLTRNHPCDDPDCGKNERAAICTLNRRRMADPAMDGFYGDRSHYKTNPGGKWSLFDLSADPHEDHDIADANPEVVKSMSRHFDDWWEKLDLGNR